MEKTNPVLRKTINKVEEKARKEGMDIWKDVSERLKEGRRNKKSVNVSKINRHAEDGETVLVPGKVTGYGNLEKEVVVAAFNFSDSAEEKINKKGNTLSILELLEENPKGENVRLMEG